jgi:hypothetical protein
MTVRELGERMDAREFAEWVAMHRFFEPLPDSWRQTGLLASASLAPYCKKGSTPKAEDFVPTEQPEQHDAQILDMIERVNAQVAKKGKQ